MIHGMATRNCQGILFLILGALLLGWFEAELLFVAGYYNLRWLARYVLVPRRLRDPAQSFNERGPSDAAIDNTQHAITNNKQGVTPSLAARSSAATH